MKPATALRIAAVIAVAWTLALLVRAATGVPSPRAWVGGLVVFAGGAVALTVAAVRLRIAPRRGSFADQAVAEGMRAAPGDPLGLLDQPFAIFHLAGTARDIENTATGARAGREVVVADYWCAPSSNPSREDIERSVCVFDRGWAGWPDLAVLPPTLGAHARDAVGSHGVELESEAFNRAFDIRCEDRRFASALLDARMMAWLLEQPPGTGLEVVAGRLIVYGRRDTSSVDDVAQALGRYDGFLAHVPPVVASLVADGAAATPHRPDR